MKTFIGLFVIFTLLLPVVSYSKMQEQTLKEFKDDQIKCLKNKADLAISGQKLVTLERNILLILPEEKDKAKVAELMNLYARASAVLKNIIELQESGKYTCGEDADDKFLDEVSKNKGYKVLKGDKVIF